MDNQITEDEYYTLIEEESTNSTCCDWYPDDCNYCRNCNFTWMQYEWDETIQKFEYKGE